MRFACTNFKPLIEAFPQIWNKDDSVALAAAEKISQLVSTIPVYRIPDLDDAFRTTSIHKGGNILSGEREFMRAYPDSFVGLASYRYGYWREEAIKELARHGSFVAWPFILYRCSDWVAPIRATAQEILYTKLPSLSYKEVYRWLPLVFRMRNQPRVKPSDLLDEIEKQIASSPKMPLSEKEEDCPSAYFQYKFELALKYGAVSDERLITEATSFDDAGVQKIACDWLSQDRWKPFRESFAHRSFTSKSPKVRLQAFWKIANVDPVAYQNEIKHALLDSDPSVQGTARGAWRMLLHRDAISFYRSQLQPHLKTVALIAVLRGLQAEGTSELAQEFRPYLKHRSGKVRAEVLQALVSWDVEDKIEILLEAMLCHSSRVAKTALALLINTSSIDPYPILKSLLLNPSHPETTRGILSSLNELPAWKSLALILISYRPPFKNQARAALTIWNEGYNRRWCVPNQSEAREVVEAFEGIANSSLKDNRLLMRTIEYLRGKI